MLNCIHQDIVTLSSVIGISLVEKSLPLEFIWDDIYELEVSRAGTKLFLVGILRRFLEKNSSILVEALKIRTNNFDFFNVFLSYQPERKYLVTWIYIPDNLTQTECQELFSDLLDTMDLLMDGLPGL